MGQRLFKIVVQCSASIVNSGIGEVVTPVPDFKHISCGEQYAHSIAIMREGDVQWVYDDSLNKQNNETPNEMAPSLYPRYSCGCSNGKCTKDTRESSYWEQAARDAINRTDEKR